VILDTVSRSRREMKRIMYLAQPYGPDQLLPSLVPALPAEPEERFGRPMVVHA